MKKFIMFIIFIGLCTTVSAGTTIQDDFDGINQELIDTTAVHFKNNNPDVTIIGLAKFTKLVDGQYTDYELLNIQFTGENTIVYLEPGMYCATQMYPKDKEIIAFQIFYIKITPNAADFNVIFEKVELSVYNYN